MREVILNYWNWFADLVNPHHDVINTISTIVIAAFAVVLARVAWKQTRDARILQRAYLNVKFGGVQSDSAGELVGHVTVPKRSERGRFIWPSPADGVVTITPAQLSYLLEGIDWRLPQQTWRPQAAG